MKKGVIFLMVFCLFLIPALSESAEELTLCGAEKNGILSPNGEMIYQVSVPAGIHLIVEMDTTSVHSQLYIKYGSIPAQNCSTDDDCDVSGYDESVEILNTQAGYYYVLVKNTSGVYNMNYTISAYDTSCPKRSITPCGAIKNGSMSPVSEDIWQIKVPAGLHLIVDTSTQSVHSQLYIKYGSIPAQNCSTDDDCDVSGYDESVEILNTQAGYYYVLVKNTSGVYNMNYTISAFRSGCDGLDVDIILNQTTFATGETLTIQARIINNDSTPYNVEVKNFIKDPNGDLILLIPNPHLTIDIAPDSDNTYTIFTLPFSGAEPSGDYQVEMKLVNPISIDYYTRDVDTFNFTP